MHKLAQDFNLVRVERIENLCMSRGFEHFIDKSARIAEIFEILIEVVWWRFAHDKIVVGGTGIEPVP